MINATLTHTEIAARYADLHKQHLQLMEDIKASGFVENFGDDVDILAVDEALHNAQINWEVSAELIADD